MARNVARLVFLAEESAPEAAATPESTTLFCEKVGEAQPDIAGIGVGGPSI
jgi:hypothetical protein